MRKPDFCICKNKGADQLHGNHADDQFLCFAMWIVQFLYFLNPKFQASSHLLYLYSPFVSDLVGNPEDMFSNEPAQTFNCYKLPKTSYGTIQCAKTFHGYLLSMRCHIFSSYIFSAKNLHFLLHYQP